MKCGFFVNTRMASRLDELLRGLRPLLREAVRAGGPWTGVPDVRILELPWSALEPAAPGLQAAYADPLLSLYGNGKLTEYLRYSGIGGVYVATSSEGPGLRLIIPAESAADCEVFVAGGTARSPGDIAAGLLHRFKAETIRALCPGEQLAILSQAELCMIVPEFRDLPGRCLTHPGVLGVFGRDACMAELRRRLEELAGVPVRVWIGPAGLKLERR